MRLLPARVGLNYLAWQWAEAHSFSCLLQPVPPARWQPWHSWTPPEPGPRGRYLTCFQVGASACPAAAHHQRWRWF